MKKKIELIYRQYEVFCVVQNMNVIFLHAYSQLCVGVYTTAACLYEHIIYLSALKLNIILRFIGLKSSYHSKILGTNM